MFDVERHWFGEEFYHRERVVSKARTEQQEQTGSAKVGQKECRSEDRHEQRAAPRGSSLGDRDRQQKEQGLAEAHHAEPDPITPFPVKLERIGERYAMVGSPHFAERD